MTRDELISYLEQVSYDLWLDKHTTLPSAIDEAVEYIKELEGLVYNNWKVRINNMEDCRTCKYGDNPVGTCHDCTQVYQSNWELKE